MALAPSPQNVHPIRRSWTHRHEGVALIAFVILAEAVGLAGAYLTPRHESWYRSLERPNFYPPSWVFAPVWSILYVLVGVSAWLVWRHHRTWQRNVALRWWTLQLLLNAAWTPLFFGARHTGWALIDLSVLLIVATITAIRFLPLDHRASALFVPYLAWICFALALNSAVVVMN